MYEIPWGKDTTDKIYIDESGITNQTQIELLITSDPNNTGVERMKVIILETDNNPTLNNIQFFVEQLVDSSIRLTYNLKMK